MLTSGEKGRKNDDSHVHDQQMQKAAETRLWEACICDGLMDKQGKRAERSEFRDEMYRDLNLMEP